MRFLSLNLGFMLALLCSTLLTACASGPDAPTNATLDMPRYGHVTVADNEYIYVIGGATGKGLLPYIEIINPKTRETTILRNKLVPRRYLSAVWDGKESIYIFGGMSSGQDRKFWHEQTVEVFNTRTRTLTTTTPMPMPRRFNSAVLLDDKIYLVGGSVQHAEEGKNDSSLRFTPWVTAFDINTQEWSRLADLPVAKETRAFAAQGKVCAIGGYDGSDKRSELDCYDPASNTWQPMPAATASVSAHSVATYNDKLYVFGDYIDLEQVMMFDFTSSSWSHIDIPYLSSRHNDAVVFGDEVFVIGGTAGTAGPYLDNIQVFSLPL